MCIHHVEIDFRTRWSLGSIRCWRKTMPCAHTEDQLSTATANIQLFWLIHTSPIQNRWLKKAYIKIELANAGDSKCCARGCHYRCCWQFWSSLRPDDGSRGCQAGLGRPCQGRPAKSKPSYQFQLRSVKDIQLYHFMISYVILCPVTRIMYIIVYIYIYIVSIMSKYINIIYTLGVLDITNKGCWQSTVICQKRPFLGRSLQAAADI